MAESEDPEQDVEASRSGEELEERDEPDGADEDGVDESGVDRDADPEGGEDDEPEDTAEDSGTDESDTAENESDETESDDADEDDHDHDHDHDHDDDDDDDDQDGDRDRDGESDDDTESESDEAENRAESDDDTDAADSDSDADDAGSESDESAEAEDDTGDDDTDDGEGTDDLLGEQYERVGPEALIDRYRPVGVAAGTPWTWSSLSPAETDALVEMIDSFVADYNEVWALADDDTIPPCWHRHPALAHDLAALTWAYYQAYLDPTATPELALRFQAHLPKFRSRLDDWLGADPAACRDNSHSRIWRRSTRPAPPAATRDSSEERDAVVLLGYRLWGFPRPDGTPPD